MSTLEATGLVKRFGKTHALDGLNLTMQPGQVMALLGPNGAGKTTFVNLVATLLRPDAGTLRVGGRRRCAPARFGAPARGAGRPVGGGGADDDRARERRHGRPPVRCLRR